MKLTALERQAVAWRLIANHIEDTEMWFHWDNVPELSEHEYKQLDKTMQNIASTIRAVNASSDRQNNIDSAELIKRMS